MSANELYWLTNFLPPDPAKSKAIRLRGLRRLPYRILLYRKQLEIARRNLREALAQKRELEAEFGKQPRETWVDLDVIEAVAREPDPVKALGLFSTLIERKLAEQKRAGRNARRRAARKRD